MTLENGIRRAECTKRTRRMGLLRAFAVTLLLLDGVVEVAGAAQGQRVRQLPDDNLAYPVQIEVGKSSGSGFFLRAQSSLFLVTALHVVVDPIAKTPRAQSVLLRSPSRDALEVTRNVYRLDLTALEAEKQIRFDPDNDIFVARIGSIGKDAGGLLMKPVAGVNVETETKGGIVVAPSEYVLPFSDVLISNTVVVFGYPSSIGIRNSPQIDYSRPLLRSGIVAGTNAARKTIILDVPVNGGNSGGPVLQRMANGPLRIIGVVIQFVPIDEDTIPPGPQKVRANSGYAVAASMDSVLALAGSLEPK